MHKLRRLFSILRQELAEPRYRRLARYDIAGYERIYHIHVRKTAGTSLNHMFLKLASPDHATLYRALVRHRDHRLLVDGKVFVGWNGRLINKGNYFYAFSHHPLHRLNLPPKTFTITCLRDPARRVISHYRMLVEHSLPGAGHPVMKTEGDWLGDSFDDFLNNVPRQHLLNQLYMFSPRFDVNEAFDAIMGCSFFVLVSRFEEDVRRLANKLNLPLQPIHMRRTAVPVSISDAGMGRLQSRLEDEYRLLDKLQREAPH